MCLCEGWFYFVAFFFNSYLMTSLAPLYYDFQLKNLQILLSLRRQKDLAVKRSLIQKAINEIQCR